jgi:hypothetical protein
MARLDTRMTTRPWRRTSGCVAPSTRDATRPVDWRKQQLRALVRMLEQHEADFVEALRLDLGKGRFENRAQRNRVCRVGSAVTRSGISMTGCAQARRHAAHGTAGTQLDPGRAQRASC